MIGIIVYSATGNTLSVAERLKDALIKGGKQAEILRFKVEGNARTGVKDLKISEQPDLSLYDAYVFAAPVQGFAVASSMNAYLKQIIELNGKKVVLLTTQHFKYAWMGGNRAIKQMTELSISHGGIVIGSAVINWSRADREEIIVNSVKQLAEKLI